MRLLLPLLMLACTQPESQSDSPRPPKEENTQFVRDETVQVTSPSNGDVVGDPSA